MFKEWLSQGIAFFNYNGKKTIIKQFCKVIKFLVNKIFTHRNNFIKSAEMSVFGDFKTFEW